MVQVLSPHYERKRANISYQTWIFTGAQTSLRRVFFFFCTGDLNAHEGLGRNVKSGERGASEALRDIWSLQARERIGAANQPAC